MILQKIEIRIFLHQCTVHNNYLLTTKCQISNSSFFQVDADFKYTGRHIWHLITCTQKKQTKAWASRAKHYGWSKQNIFMLLFTTFQKDAQWKAAIKIWADLLKSLEAILNNKTPLQICRITVQIEEHSLAPPKSKAKQGIRHFTA